MKIENDIGWCDATTNAVTGCDKVSRGCKNCFAEKGTRARVLRAQGIETWGPKGVRYPVNFEPVFRRLNKLCICDKCHEVFPFNAESVDVGCIPRGECPTNGCGFLRRIRLFADVNSDWLDERWPIETLARFLDAIRLAPNIDTLLLTKRIEKFASRLDRVFTSLTDESPLKHFVNAWLSGNAPKHVWLGVSVEDKPRADERIAKLLATPAAVRFLSVEPLLEAVNLNLGELNYARNRDGNTCGKPWISWLIVGGESGWNRRDCGVEAIISVAKQCVAAGVPVYVKQDCAFKSGQQGRIPDDIWKLKQFP